MPRRNADGGTSFLTNTLLASRYVAKASLITIWVTALYCSSREANTGVGSLFNF